MNYTIERRNSDFTKAVNAELWRTAGDGSKLGEVIKRVAEGEAREYYVNYETAYRWVCQGLRGNFPCVEDSHKRRKWRELTRKVLEKMHQKPWYSIALALVEVLDNEKASSYFMNYETARWVYYCTMRRQRKSRCGGRIRHLTGK